jgi:hypothetical protein
MFSRVCTAPLGQVTLSCLTSLSLPSPKWTCRSDAQPYPTAVFTWLCWVPEAVVTLTFVPMASRFPLAPIARIRSQ